MREELKLCIDACRAAGEILLRYYRGSFDLSDKGENHPVTSADLEADACLKRILLGAYPEYGWLSEETEDNAQRLGKESVFIIDPIDGTRSFVEGSNTWAHSLAVADGGEITAAVVFLPMRDKLYAAAKGQGATLNGATLRAARQPDLSQTTVLAAKPALMDHLWHSGSAPTFKRSYRPSLAYRLALVGEGRFDAMLTLRRSWEWDIAAGALIVSEAGGVCSDQKGAPLVFNNADPRLNGVVAGGPPTQAALIAALA